MFRSMTLQVARVTFLLAAIWIQVSTAIPQLQGTPTVTVTVSKCPLGKCTKICATPTVTVEPAKKCPFDVRGCPMARCIGIPTITSTSTSYCTNTCTSLTTKRCERLPTATVVPPCPTRCPELCPFTVETVAVACPVPMK